jgi:hypothetical protein
MNRRMSTRPCSPIRFPAPAWPAALAVLLAGWQLVGGPQAARAGCLDWLFGRHSTQTAYYPTTANYAAAYPPAYAAAYPPATTGVIQSQRPAYGLGATVPVQTFDNPSVYTGLPTGTAVAPPTSVEVQRLPATTTTPSPTTVGPAYSPPSYGAAPATSLDSVDSYRLPLSSPGTAPIASTLRGNAGVNPIASSPYAAYSPPTAAPAAVAATNYTAAATPPAVLPVAPQRRWTFGSGLRRFFNSLLGRDTNYVTSYYTAPITYYRPASTVDPVTGTTVTVQQPCSSYVQQLQRVPYSSFQLQPNTPGALPTTPPATTAAPTTIAPDACSPSMLGSTMPPPSFPPSSTPGTFAPPSGVGQVGGQTDPSGSFVTPIPSTVPGGSPNTAPLRGSDPVSGAEDPSDRQQIPQPRLEVQSERPELTTPPQRQTRPSKADNGRNGYGDDTYPYGQTSPPNAPTDDRGNNNGDRFNGNRNGNGNNGNGNDEPAIRLDPPVSQRDRGVPPTTPQDRSGRFTQTIPPSLSGAGSNPNTAASNSNGGTQPYSTLRPIGIPALPEPDKVPPFTGSDSAPAPSTTNPFQNRTDAPQAPRLPPSSSNPADASGLFRHSERSASRRGQGERVTVPVREATTRSGNVRQVAAWDEEVPPLPPAQPKPRRSPRDTGGWLPAN